MSSFFFILLYLHSLLRWLVLASLLYTLYRAYNGYAAKKSFTKTDHTARFWAVTISHIQLTVGLILYIKSAVPSYFWKNFSTAVHQREAVFFGLLHILLMITAVTVITVGSALSKRKENDREKFLTMFIWFALALLIIFIAIPWPFSPLANRPYLRHF
ncbi:MAG: hypothetical protein QM802_23860 [Agriterribacter sp.]